MTDIKNSEGTFTLDIRISREDLDISVIIPQQVIYLRSYRIELADNLAAILTKLLYLEAPFFSSNQLISTNPGHNYLPLFIGSTKVTTAHSKNVPVYLSGPIPKKFHVRVLDPTFTPVQGLVRLTLMFSFQKGALS